MFNPFINRLFVIAVGGEAIVGHMTMFGKYFGQEKEKEKDKGTLEWISKQYIAMSFTVVVAVVVIMHCMDSSPAKIRADKATLGRKRFRLKTRTRGLLWSFCYDYCFSLAPDK